MLKPSGPNWCSEFPCSVRLEDLASPFRENAERFVEALRNSGASVSIATTRRPRERAYLMHYAYQIAYSIDPKSVPSMPGVNIDWAHGGDVFAAKAAATEMVRTYGIKYIPSLDSNHIRGLAIDMTVSWRGQIKVVDARKVEHLCREPHDLWAIGASYSVFKLPADPPHWSFNGR